MRQRFAKGQGGTLRCHPIEVSSRGIPSSATVTLKRAYGTDVPVPVNDAAVAIDPDTGELSFVLVPANTPDPLTAGGLITGLVALADSSYLYRALWTYTIAGVVYQADQTYEVNARLLKPTLLREDVTPLLPATWEELLDGGDAAIDAAVGTAWDDLLEDLSAKGYRPDKILDPERLKRPHRSKVIANLYDSFGPQWAEAASKKFDAYLRDLDAALAALDWYDTRPDNIRAQDEASKVPTIVCTR